MPSSHSGASDYTHYPSSLTAVVGDDAEFRLHRVELPSAASSFPHAFVRGVSCVKEADTNNRFGDGGRGGGGGGNDVDDVDWLQEAAGDVSHYSGGDQRSYLPPSVPASVAKRQWCLGVLQVGRASFLVCGTHRGTVQLYEWPLHAASACIKEVSVHDNPIVSLRVCQKTGVVLTAGLNGSVFVSHITANMGLGGGERNSERSNNMHNGGGGGGDRGGSGDGAASGAFNVVDFLAPSLHPPLYACMPPLEMKAARKRLNAAYAEERVCLRDKETYGSRALRGRSDYGVALVRAEHVDSLVRLVTVLRSRVYAVRGQWAYKARRDEEGVRKLLRDQKEIYDGRLAFVYEKKRMLQQKDVARESEVQMAFKAVCDTFDVFLLYVLFFLLYVLFTAVALTCE
jgi:hypothetical protein